MTYNVSGTMHFSNRRHLAVLEALAPGNNRSEHVMTIHVCIVVTCGFVIFRCGALSPYDASSALNPCQLLAVGKYSGSSVETLGVIATYRANILESSTSFNRVCSFLKCDIDTNPWHLTVVLM
jgi:hypothetical protein